MLFPLAPKNDFSRLRDILRKIRMTHRTMRKFPFCEFSRKGHLLLRKEIELCSV